MAFDTSRCALARAIAVFVLPMTVMAVDSDTPPPNAKPLSVIIKQLEDTGYTVRDIEFDDGRYEVEARDKEGRERELKADPVTGKIRSIDQ